MRFAIFATLLAKCESKHLILTQTDQKHRELKSCCNMVACKITQTNTLFMVIKVSTIYLSFYCNQYESKS